MKFLKFKRSKIKKKIKSKKWIMINCFKLKKLKSDEVSTTKNCSKIKIIKVLKCKKFIRLEKYPYKNAQKFKKIE